MRLGFVQVDMWELTAKKNWNVDGKSGVKHVFPRGRQVRLCLAKLVRTDTTVLVTAAQPTT